MPQRENILSLVGMLYDATLDTEKWQPFLEKCCEVFNANAAQWGYLSLEPRELSFSVLHNISPEKTAEYDLYSSSDPRLPLNLGKPWHPGLPHPDNRSYLERYNNGYAVHCRMFATTEAIHNSDMYKKVLNPSNIEYACAIHHQLNNNEVAFLGVMRSRDFPQFTLKDCKLFDQIRIHVKQAAVIHRELCQLDFDRRAALETLNTLNLGLLLVDQRRQLLFANQQGCTVLDARDGFGLNGRAVCCDGLRLNDELDDAVRHVIEHAGKGRQTPGRALFVDRPSGQPAYSILISPLWNNLVRIQSGTLDYPIASIFIQDPERTANTHIGLLQEFYTLTETETRVLGKLVQGRTTAEIARQMKVQDNTVRQHLKNIFAKTETKTQSHLIQTVMAGPFWLGSHEFGN